MKSNYLEDWEPTEDIGFFIGDKTGEKRSEEQIDQLFEEIRVVANKHNFDLCQWGLRKSFKKYFSSIEP